MKEITIAVPDRTKSVSVTGRRCALNCSHCGKIYLKGMEDISDTIKKGIRSYSSFLISGGMNKDGYVEIEKHCERLIKIKSWGAKINAHAGLIPHEELKKAASHIDALSIDFVSDKRTIEEAYHTDWSVKDYVRLVENARNFIEPDIHVTIGLYGGEIRGELESVRILKSLGIRRIVFLVMIPTKGTAYGKCQPTSLKELDKFFFKAREIMPDEEFISGCMHPRGEYSDRLDDMAIKYSFSRIAMPGTRIREKAAEQGIILKESRECCIL